MFIWEKEIKEINGITVTFTDGTKKECTEENLKYLQTEEAISEKELKEKSINNTVNWIFSVIHDHDVRNSDLIHIINRIKNEMLYKELWVLDTVNDILKVIEDHGVGIELIGDVLQKTHTDYNKNVDAVMCKILGIDDLDDLSAKKIAEFKNS